jgi:hypothetical protein
MTTEILKHLQQSAEYFRSFPAECLAAWVRDRKDDDTVACAYCDAILLSAFPECFQQRACGVYRIGEQLI